MTVQAGTLTHVLADRLAKNRPPLILPLADNPLKSISSNLLYEQGNSSCLMRSLGSLSDHVSKIYAVTKDGQEVVFNGKSGVEECKKQGAVITRIELQAVPAENLWMFCMSFPYPGLEHFSKIAENLRTQMLELRFSESSDQTTDLMLDTYKGRHGIPFVKITAIQYSETKREPQRLRELVENALNCLPPEVQKDKAKEVYFGSSVLNVITDTRMLCASTDSTTDSEKCYADINTRDQWENYVKAVNRGFDSRTGILSGDEYHAYRLQVNRNNNLELAGYIHTPKRKTISISSAATATAATTTATATATATAISNEAFFADSFSDLLPYFTETERAEPIPNFKGSVYQQGDSDYDEKKQQYATSSYPAAGMTPFMIAYPLDENDIQAAIKFAQESKKHIVARSGGHQYTGKSSGGQDTIVLSMDNFNTLQQVRDQVEVGPAVRLTDFARQFKEWGITIPHGECPQVAIGGHAQTGGYGHLARSFGLALDYVQAFDIVLADGRKITVTRPTSVAPTDESNREIFRGVLSGNAGSFGVVTKYVLNCIKDRDHLKSYGFKVTRRYNHDTFSGLMANVQEWTDKIARKDDGDLRGLDFTMTIESSTIGTLFPLLLVELVYSDPDNGTPYSGQFQSITDKAAGDLGILRPFCVTEGDKGLSALSDSFVRRWPATTMDGREFGYPYKKRVNCTMQGLTSDFVRCFVEKINSVVTNESGVKLVFQMIFGGGAYREKGNEQVQGTTVTSIPHRNYAYCFVFDLFYESGKEQRAEQLQQDMQGIIDRYYNYGQERRVFWGTFGTPDQTDMSNEAVRRMYYDTEAQYAELQKLKAKVDSADVFHTGLTVQLPR